MEIDVSYTRTKYYDITNIIQWVYYFEKYKYVRGFKLRVFGIGINIRENKATEKLMKIWHEKRLKK